MNEFKMRMEVALEEAKAALVKSKDDMAKYYDGEEPQPRSINLETEYS